MEEEGPLIEDSSIPSYSSSYALDEANLPLPTPRDEEEAERMMDAICEGVHVLPSIRRRMLSMLNNGILTPHMAAGMTGRRQEDAA